MRIALASLALALSASAALAQESCGNTADGFKPFIQEMKREAAAAGVSKRSIAVLDTVTYDTAIIKRDRGQSIFSDSFLTFQKKMISAAVSAAPRRRSSSMAMSSAACRSSMACHRR